MYTLVYIIIRDTPSTYLIETYAVYSICGLMLENHVRNVNRLCSDRGRANWLKSGKPLKENRGERWFHADWDA